ncbi:MAG: hypothetical protein OHK0029_10940 [Armatimonadaceae bacterium]
MVKNRILFPNEWEWTDDTLFALSVFEKLKHGMMEQDRLAKSFTDIFIRSGAMVRL